MASLKTIVSTLAIFFMLSMILLSQFGCTEPPVYSYVSDLPAIEPEGEFFNLRKAIMTENTSQVGVLFADEFFVDKQNLLLQKYDFGTKVIKDLDFLFQNYIFQIEKTEMNYKYDQTGKFQIGRGHTAFTGSLISRIDSNEKIPESIKKLSKKDDENKAVPDTVKIYIIWVGNEINWRILHFEINNIPLSEILN